MMMNTRDSGTRDQAVASLPPVIGGVDAENDDQVALLHYAWSAENMQQGNFRPERYIVMIAGRPVVCVTLSHNAAPAGETWPYLRDLFKPVVPLVLFGCTGRSSHAPNLRRAFSVSQGWKAVLLPFMCHKCFPPDTLFIVAEPDFVLDRESADTMAQVFGSWQDSAPKAASMARAKDSARSKHAPSRAISRPKAPTRGQTKEDFAFYKFGPGLRDLVGYATAAHRHGRGNFVWASWNASHWKPNAKKVKRKRTPAAGAHLFLITAEGARQLREAWQDEWKDSQMGTLLTNNIFKHRQEEFKACYIYPPLGTTAGHVSTTTQGQYMPSHFENSKRVEGTRPTDDSQEGRWICKWTPKGQPDYLNTEPIVFPRDLSKFLWITLPPPTLDPKFRGVSQRHLGIQVLTWFCYIGLFNMCFVFFVKLLSQNVIRK